MTKTAAPPVQRPVNIDMETLRKNAVPMSRWGEVVEEISKFSPTIAAGFTGSKAFVSGDYILVDSDKDICFEQLRNADLRRRIRDTIEMILGKKYNLGRYSYPDEQKKDDPLRNFLNDLNKAGVKVQEE